MSLEAFLLTWVDETFPITKIFPQGYSNKKILAELIIITKSLINCGKGSLQHKNKVFYYRTYMPTLVLGEESNSKKSISSDFFVYSFNSNNKKVFLLYLTDTNFNKKDIDSLTKKIYEILDEGAFEKHDIKKESARRINFLYDQYKNPETNSGCYIQLNEIKEIKKTKKRKKLRDYQLDLLESAKPVISLYSYNKLKQDMDEIQKRNKIKKKLNFKYIKKIENKEAAIIKHINKCNKNLKNTKSVGQSKFVFNLPFLKFKRVVQKDNLKKLQKSLTKGKDHNSEVSSSSINEKEEENKNNKKRKIKLEIFEKINV